MTLADLTPDVSLKKLLDGLQVQTSTEPIDVSVYAQGEMPNVDLGDAFVSIEANGFIESVTRPIGMYRGDLMLSILIKCYDNGTANTNRIKQLLSQIEQRCDCKVSDGFFFEFLEYSVITPTYINNTTGYATTVLNLSWHTIHK